ncbi:30S ribosomal protein S18 [Ureaplasma miroungigenitalium]|uniref:Small ribosomal subunit protein bS18 n=1 Tax=Ureaplasma miroungigenitalium TaxID=1042321 RepID=A0ABT3BMJ0_9BACT|nr:30S ribosomal protein S18 [Ureaplasma miroungigenitalium]MCV3728445.1 30S ribosomal protein S18 [Ureaplasma miroungigenitalium]MCV3734232.1 30S ribosomal protein S18 [Ureaplasma miroungigenitalium]
MANYNNFNKRRPRKKICTLSAQGIEHVDYKDTELLLRFINNNNKISPRRVTGCSARMQRRVANAIKRARFVGLLPFVKE